MYHNSRTCLILFALLAIFIVNIDFVNSQDTCGANQFFNGQNCTCIPGYYTTSTEELKKKCQSECEEIYFSFFTYGACAKLGKEKTCNALCGVRLRLWASIGIFCVFAAALATLIFTLPMCGATCVSCLHSKKASKHSKRVYVEQQQQQQPVKDQQLQTLSYNPYVYWPYYGRA